MHAGGRCAEAKLRNPELLTIVQFVSSNAPDADARAVLRAKNFVRTREMRARTLYRRAKNDIVQDLREVCVVQIFFLTPWILKKKQGRWTPIHAEELINASHENRVHQDIVFTPIRSSSNARSRVLSLLHLFAWARHNMPWADYIVRTDDRLHIHWPSAIELFPPPSSNTGMPRLWHLGEISDRAALAFGINTTGVEQRCAGKRIHAFSRGVLLEFASLDIGQIVGEALLNPLHIASDRSVQSH